jgi:hypothetical protein
MGFGSGSTGSLASGRVFSGLLSVSLSAPVSLPFTIGVSSLSLSLILFLPLSLNLSRRETEKKNKRRRKKRKGKKDWVSLLSDYLSHSHRLCLSLFEIDEERRRN